MSEVIETTAVVRAEEHAQTALSAPRSVAELTARVKLIQEVTRKVMKDGHHYGKVPGTEKRALLKPGAEILSLTFRLVPQYRITTRDLPNGHREHEVICQLSDGTEGVGSCSTMETKYRFRNAARKCPACGKEAIIKGKAEYGGGWLCFKKKEGCGAKFVDGAPEIEGQVSGQVENTNPADQFNTVLKMAKKRAHIDAVITATGASDTYTQDVADIEEAEEEEPAAPALAAEGVWIGGIERCETQKHTTGKEWHTIFGDDGTKFITWDSEIKLASLAVEGKVALSYKTDSKGFHKVVGVEPAPVDAMEAPDA